MLRPCSPRRIQAGSRGSTSRRAGDSGWSCRGSARLNTGTSSSCRRERSNFNDHLNEDHFPHSYPDLGESFDHAIPTAWQVWPAGLGTVPRHDDLRRGLGLGLVEGRESPDPRRLLRGGRQLHRHRQRLHQRHAAKHSWASSSRGTGIGPCWRPSTPTPCPAPTPMPGATSART